MDLSNARIVIELENRGKFNCQTKSHAMGHEIVNQATKHALNIHVWVKPYDLVLFQTNLEINSSNPLCDN